MSPSFKNHLFQNKWMDFAAPLYAKRTPTALWYFAEIFIFLFFFVSPGHYGKENLRSGGQDMHNFISSGFVTLGRGHLKGKVHPHYLFSLHSTLRTKFRIIIISLTKLLCHAVVVFLPNECAQDCAVKNKYCDFCFSSVEVGHHNT